MAYQSKNASQDGRRNMLAALQVDSGVLPQLGVPPAAAQASLASTKNRR